MSPFLRRVLFLLFFLSGFSSLVYQVVWTRLAFASFGIITPVLSVVLSVFMLGLALGSWAGGRWIAPLTARTGWPAIYFYAAAEAIIGVGGVTAPKLFTAGERLLLSGGAADSFSYLSLSAVVLAAAMLPWCFCMGTTFPLMMAHIRERTDGEARSFSFLYLANVLGAMAGTLLAAVVYIEILGFSHTLQLAAAGNFVIALIAMALGRLPVAPSSRPRAAASKTSITIEAPLPETGAGSRIPWILFSTGFIAMAMEVVWTRAFTPTLKTQVYSFALIVFTYLGATFIGSWWYRLDLRKGKVRATAQIMAALAASAFLPVVANDGRLLVADFSDPTPNWPSALALLASIIPFCAALGYLTPGLVDQQAAGQPDRAGRAYAINVLGCILGPLVACYLLLPRLSERYALILLALPLLVFCFQWRRAQAGVWRAAVPLALILILGWSAFGTEDFETKLKKEAGASVRRDYCATVISFGENRSRKLLVNGFGMTSLTPITKLMVHLPLAALGRPPESVLVICFGMGTSFRSAMSWNVDTTAVELVPSVPRAFGFYHADADRLLDATNGHVIIDDGRRYLKRTHRQFDVIIVDPPPPVQAAGSSLLFSTEFYASARQHLKPGGIIQMWYPGDPDVATDQAVLRSLTASFPYVRCLKSTEGWGYHLFGSMTPINFGSAEQLAARLPPAAVQDLLEWSPTNNAAAYLGLALAREFPADQALNPDPDLQVTDDHPFNEYYLLRTLAKRFAGDSSNP
jgi:predicted membrane-bound spermidine synthase